MKVMMVPHPLNLTSGEGGIHTVARKYVQHGPSVGIEYVDSNADSFDVLAVHAGMTKQLAAPFVAHCHGLYFTADYQADPWQFKANRDVIESLRYANEITVPTHWVNETLQRDMHLSAHVVPHGVDWQEWQHKEPNEGYVLWNKNRLADVCSPVAVGELAKRFPDQNFLTTFAPKGDYTNVRTSGVLSYSQMRTTVQRASVYLATIKETFGVGTLEAMAAGRPILGFRHGGTAQLVRHGVNGYLAEPGNYEDLARGLNYCLAHAEILGENSRLLARAYGWQQVVEQLYEVYTLALASVVADSVTVVVPCYNYGSVLRRAVQSILNQTVQAQVVIVNNNSTDNTEEVARALEDEYPTRIRYVNCPAQGVAHARNYGIALAKTKYVACLDADDEIKPGFLEVCVRALEADPALGLAYTRLEWVQPDGQRGVSQWPGEYNYDSFIKGQNQVPTACIFKRQLWARLGGYRQRYAPEGAGAEDADFWFRMGAIGFSGKLASNEALFVYHLGGRVSGNAAYHEVDWRKWHSWVKDQKHPFASVATARNGMSHLVRQYDQPQISVVIPCSPNHAQYLVDVLDSLEAQTFRQWEAIVVCDGFEPEESLQTTYPFVRFLDSTSALGAGSARNKGAAKARGKYLLFLDADDWLEPEALERLLAAASTHNAVAYSDYAGHALIAEAQSILQLQDARRLLAHNERTKETVIAHRAFDYDCALAQRQPELNAQGEFYIWCLIASLVPKQWHEEVGGFDESMASWEDYDYWIRLARAGKCFVRVPERLLNYRFHTGTRRELASPATSGSRQLAKTLIEYLHEKFSGEKPMGCTGCSKPSSPVMEHVPAMMTPQMPANETVEVQLVDGNRGDHSITGVATKTFYGYRKDGDQFLMNRQDAVMQPKSFRILEAVVIDDVPQADVFALPPPVPSFDFTSLPDVNQDQADKLAEMGIRTLSGLSMANNELLKDIFGARQLKRIMRVIDDPESWADELDRKEVDMTR